MTLIVSTQKVKYFKMWRAYVQKVSKQTASDRLNTLSVSPSASPSSFVLAKSVYWICSNFREWSTNLKCVLWLTIYEKKFTVFFPRGISFIWKFMTNFPLFLSLLYRGFELPQETGGSFCISLSKREIASLLLWMGSVDHPFCSVSRREGGCCRHWGTVSAVKGNLKSWGMQNQCPFGVLPEFACCVWADLKAGKGDLVTSAWFALSPCTLGSWQNQLGSTPPWCWSFREWAEKTQSEVAQDSVLLGAPLKLPKTLLKLTPFGRHGKLSVSQCWCNCRRVFFQESLQ